MNPLAYFKIFNNEDCPCGSGKKFKEMLQRKTRSAAYTEQETSRSTKLWSR